MNRIPAQDYIDYAPESIGEKVSINHTHCPEGVDVKKRLWIKRKRNGVEAWCYNCGLQGFTGIKSRRRWMTPELEKALNESDKPCLPIDFTRNIPTKYKAERLYRYSITDEDIYQHKIGWSEGLQRIILPVYKDSELVCWQGRAVHDSQKVKYRGQRGITVVPNIIRNRYSDKLVIVEDTISAIRVSHVCSACAISGTSLSDTQRYQIANEFKDIVLWMDGDTAGQVARNKLYKKFSVLCDSVAFVDSKLDPKCYGKREIKLYLEQLK